MSAFSHLTIIGSGTVLSFLVTNKPRPVPDGALARSAKVCLHINYTGVRVHIKRNPKEMDPLLRMHTNKEVPRKGDLRRPN